MDQALYWQIGAALCSGAHNVRRTWSFEAGPGDGHEVNKRIFVGASPLQRLGKLGLFNLEKGRLYGGLRREPAGKLEGILHQER